MGVLGVRSRRFLPTVVVSVVLVAACGTSDAEEALAEGILSAPLEATSTVLADGFVIPQGVAVIGEDEYLISTRASGLHHYADGETAVVDGTPAVEVFSTGGVIVGGMMDVSLHPDFEDNGLVYLAYLDEDLTFAVSRFDFSDRSLADAEVIFESEFQTLGAAFAWQDADHFFISIGTTDVVHPQDLSVDGGKIHRLRADGSVPDDNPTFDDADGPSSIWSIGHRNNQGLVFDDGALYATEHGDIGGDEFNLVERAGNFGFPNVTSGGLNFDNVPSVSQDVLDQAIDPLVTWPDFTIAPTGVTRLTGSAFAELDGQFLFGGLQAQNLFAVNIETGETSLLVPDAGRVRDVAQLPSGDILMLSEFPLDAASNGELIRLSPAG